MGGNEFVPKRICSKQAPGSSPICLSGKNLQIRPQIRNPIELKSAIVDRDSLRNPRDACQYGEIFLSLRGRGTSGLKERQCMLYSYNVFVCLI
jgi:hypothetical protein